MNLAQRISQLSPEQRKQFEIKLKQQGIDISQIISSNSISGGSNTPKGITPNEKKEYYPLSAFQNRMYILNQFMEYSLPLVYQIEGKLDKNRFQLVFQELIKRHESFRSTIETIKGEAVQRIHRNADIEFNVEYFDASLPNTGQERTQESNTSITGLIKQFFRPFDLTLAPLLRVRLIKCAETRHIFLLNINHIIADGFSWGILTYELMRLYKSETLPILKIKYTDFSLWQNQWLSGDDYKKKEAFWLGQFPDKPPVLNLNTDFPRPPMQQFDGRVVHFDIESQKFQDLKNLTNLQNTSFFMVLLTILNTLLFHYTSFQQEDIIIGTIVAGREHLDLQKIIGLFINTIVLRNSPAQNKPFGNFLQEVKQNTLAAFENQAYPFGDLLEKVITHKDLSRNPLFDVMIVYQNRNIGNLEEDGLRFVRSPEHEPIEHAQQDITLWVWEEEDKISIDLEYCTALYKAETMEHLIDHFLTLLSNCAAHPQLKLSQQEIICAAEKQQLLVTFNDSKPVKIPNETICSLFEKQVEQSPDRIALVGPSSITGASNSQDNSNEHLSYRQLNQQTIEIAFHLKQNDKQSDYIVGIMVPPSNSMITGLLGILKAGMAYLPLNPQDPPKRQQYILKDSNTKTILTTGELTNTFIREKDNELINVIDIEQFQSPMQSNRVEDKLSSDFANNLAYIIYTSGSTGKPKGVMTEHFNLTAYLSAFSSEFEISHQDTVIQQATFTFDAFAEEIYPLLMKGGKIAIPTKNTIKDTELLIQFIIKHEVTIIDCSPLLLNQLNQQDFKSSLRIFISGGDVLKGEYINNLVKRGLVYNTYGPTESTICASYYKCEDPVPSSVPIGKPISNYTLKILNRYNGLLPVGVAGELSIAGPGVSRGYLNRPELTNERFCNPNLCNQSQYNNGTLLNAHPLNSSPINSLERMYKSGDLARWNHEGNIEFLGRIDQQVKIRGFRIELREIEYYLLSHPEINNALVILRDDSTNEKELYAYIEPVSTHLNSNNEHALTVSQLRKYLAAQLPEYMIPAHFIKIDRIPVTPNGKIDTKALYQYDQQKIETGNEYIEPKNEIEVKLAGIWSTLLRKEKISTCDNFFDLGGQSILAMKAVSIIQEEFKIRIPLITFFQAGTIQGIAAIISDSQKNGTQNQQQNIITKKGLIQPFELNKAPLLRTIVVKLKDNNHFFFIDMHHIIGDGISLDIIATEFIELYSGTQLDTPITQYKEFAQWQKNFFVSPQFNRLETYWLDIFSGKIPRLNLPLDYPRPAIRKGEGQKLQKNLDSNLSRELKNLALDQGVTLFMLLLAAYTILLYQITEQNDIIIGTPASGRTQANTMQIVGIFVNTVALRIKPQSHYTFYEFLHLVKEQTLSALENQNYPFELLVEKLNLSGETSRNPLFDTLFTLQLLDETIKWEDQSSDDKTSFIPHELEYKGAIFDLILGASGTTNRIQLNITYNLHLFKKETIEDILNRYIRILTWITTEPEGQLQNAGFEQKPSIDTDQYSDSKIIPANIDVYKTRYDDKLSPVEISTTPLELTPQQKEWILFDFNNSQMEYPEQATIHSLFETQAQKYPQRTAIHCENNYLTYKQLNEKSDEIAIALIGKGLKPESFVGMMVEQSQEVMIAILGIHKAGGCYLPIEPEYPEEQIRFLEADTSCTIIITQQKYKTHLSNITSTDIVIIDNPFPVTSQREENLYRTNKITSGQLAYIIYTSGSTGKPKGVIVDHSSVVNRLFWMQWYYPLSENDIFLQKTTFIFDVSVVEFFSWYMGGSQLCFLKPGRQTDLKVIFDTICKKQITALSFTPTIFHTFLISINKENHEKLNSLKWIFCAGEQLPASLVERWKNLPIKAKLENLYGPTEATVYASYYSCHPQINPIPIPIGKPLGNTRLYILGKNHELLPPGEVGELVLAGGSLARGYMNQPQLTHEKFSADPFFPGEKMYHTGDYAKLLPEGNVVYLGRMDHQVKIKGVRIELEEIESVLLKHPYIAKAAVITRDDSNGVKYLAAYIETRQELTHKDIKTYLSEKLPKFMIPASFYKVKQMPLTGSGKLDRKRLPKLGTLIQVDREYIAPQNQLERQLVQIWEKFLNLERIGIQYNFFEIGGDSLKGNLMLAEINNQFGTGTLIKHLFEAPTIKEFAKLLSSSQTTKYLPVKPIEKKEYYPATSAQKRLFILNNLDKNDTSYNFSLGLVIKGNLKKHTLISAVEQLVQRHEAFRTEFVMKEGEIVQKINDKQPIDVKFIDGAQWDETQIETIIQDIQLAQSTETQPVKSIEDNSLSSVKLTKIKRKQKVI